MGRTSRDLTVYGRSEAEVWNGIQDWMRAYGGHVSSGPMPGPYGTHVAVQMGSGVWQATRFVEITWRPFQGGVAVHTEGYAKGFGQEMDFSPNAIGGALPRREGWTVINDLWNRLAWMSTQASQPTGPAPPAAPAAGPQPAAPAAGVATAPPGGGPSMETVNCPNCGTSNRKPARFCGSCGSQLAP